MGESNKIPLISHFSVQETNQLQSTKNLFWFFNIFLFFLDMEGRDIFLSMEFVAVIF